MMKTKKQESGGGAEGVLSSDLVLTRNPRVTSIAGEQGGPSGQHPVAGQGENDAKDVNTSNSSNSSNSRMTGSGGMPADGPISVSTLLKEERELLALVDGHRSVGELIRLSGMSEEVVQKRLRALRARDILMIDTAPAATDGGVAQDAAEDPEGDAAADGSSALTRAIDEYLDLAASALTSAAAAEEASKMAVANMSADSATVLRADGTSITTLPGLVPTTGSPPAGVASGATASPVTASTGAPSEVAASLEPGSGKVVAAAGFSQQTFKPNVTAFWIPSMGDVLPSPLALPFQPPAARDLPGSGARLGGAAPSGAGALSGAGASSGAPAVAPDGKSRVSSEAATVVVKGSPLAGAAAGDGVASGEPQGQVNAPIPFRVGNYEVATRIAQGGMGSIYVCRRAGDPGFQRLFTLKVVRQHSAKRDEAVRSFKREAHVGSMLSHPNLQTVLDTGSYKDQPFLVLDYIEGTSLSELIAEDRRAPVGVAVTILLDVLRGLEHAHQMVDDKGARLGLVHGDVSPQNVLVGVDSAARLTDFGSATFTGEGRRADPKWIATGKPSYMSPEQLRAEPLDARTDVFAVGVLMWSVLTGQKLFAGDSYDETIIKVLRKKIPPPSSFGAPAFLDDVCLKALSRAREGRYASAEEMAKDLARVAASHNVLASPAEVGQWVRRESGETLGEQRRRIQFMFGAGPRAGSAPAAGSGSLNAPGISPRPHSDGAAPSGGGRVGPATIVLDSIHRNVATPELGAHKSLPARTVFLPAVRRPVEKTFWRTWNVVIVSALLALPITLTIGYFVSNLFVSHPVRPPAPPMAAVNSADAATSQ